VNGDGHDAKIGGGEHHRHIGAVGESGQELGVAGMMESRCVEHLFLNGIGDERAGAVLARQGNAGLDRRDHRGRIGRIGPTGNYRLRDRERQHRERIGENARRFLELFQRLHRHRQAERPRQAREAPGIIDHDERGQMRAVALQPGLEGDFAADTCGLTHGERKRQTHPRMST